MFLRISSVSPTYLQGGVPPDNNTALHILPSPTPQYICLTISYDL